MIRNEIAPIQALSRLELSIGVEVRMGWFPKHGYESVLRMLGDEISEVLPVNKIT